MKVLAKSGRDDLATVYIAQMDNGKLVEFVESVQPPIPRSKKWVLIISTLYGCPVGCRFCDAGHDYQGKLSQAEMMAQIDYLVGVRFPGKNVAVDKFKIQFARMGDPAFNPAVLDVLEELPLAYNAPGLMPTISTIAPRGTDSFFKRLLRVKMKHYKGRFQLQFSIHTTDLEKRDWLMPVKKWDFAQIADYGRIFWQEGNRKIALNFAWTNNMPIDPQQLARHFDPEIFLIKITPINPTHRARQHGVYTGELPSRDNCPAIQPLEDIGYEVIISIGELAENDIGSNCGQYVTNYLARKAPAVSAFFVNNITKQAGPSPIRIDPFLPEF